VPDAYKLRIERTDASVKAQYSLLGVATQSIMDVINEDVEISPGKCWKKAGSKWDVAALQCLTDLISKRIQDSMHCVAGGEFSATVRYAQQTLVILGCPAIRILFYKPVPLSSKSPIPETPPTANLDPSCASSVKVLESLEVEEDTLEMAKACLGAEAGPEDTTASMDAETAAHATATARAVRLRDALNFTTGPQWHVVYDKHPVAVSVPTPVRMTLQRGRYTFVVFRHAAEEPSWFHLAQLNPTAVKVVLAALLLGAYLTYKTSCRTVESKWAVNVCGKLDANMHFILFAIAMVFVYSRLISFVKKMQAGKRKPPATGSGYVAKKDKAK